MIGYCRFCTFTTDNLADLDAHLSERHPNYRYRYVPRYRARPRSQETTDE